MDHVKVPIELVGLCTLGGFLIPFLLSALIRILMGTNGRYFILLPFTIAFLSDAGAYFVGLRLGRHKLAPVISPKKTIEALPVDWCSPWWGSSFIAWCCSWPSNSG